MQNERLPVTRLSLTKIKVYSVSSRLLLLATLKFVTTRAFWRTYDKIILRYKCESFIKIPTLLSDNQFV